MIVETQFCNCTDIFRKDELRLKSNSDLHKLWFVLLKERNMLLTMEEAFKDKVAPMPNPERMDKVELSMEHLEEVVRETGARVHALINNAGVLVLARLEWQTPAMIRAQIQVSEVIMKEMIESMMIVI